MAEKTETIAANVKRLRKERGLSQTALANAMQAAGATHWRQTTVSRVEDGAQVLRVDEVEPLAAVLGPDVFQGTSLSIASDPTEWDPRARRVRKMLVAAWDALLQAQVELGTARKRVESLLRDGTFSDAELARLEGALKLTEAGMVPLEPADEGVDDGKHPET